MLAKIAIATRLIPTLERVLSRIVIGELKIRCTEITAMTKTSTVLIHHSNGNAKTISPSNNPTQASMRDRSDFRNPNRSIFCLGYTVIYFIVNFRGGCFICRRRSLINLLASVPEVRYFIHVSITVFQLSLAAPLNC